MCRSTDQGGRRCEKCNDPETRRNRQNLANAVKREEVKVAPEDSGSSTMLLTREEPPTLAEMAAAEMSRDGFEEFEEAEVRDAIASMLTGPAVAQQMSKTLREDREKAESNRAWLLNGKEDTPENLAAGIAERHQEIILVGAVIAERAQAIHGLDMDAEREAWQARLEKEYEILKPLKDDYSKTSIEHYKRREELIKKYNTNPGDLSKHVTDEESKELIASARILTSKSKLVDAAQSKVQIILDGDDEETMVVQEKISAANRQAICEVRPVGNVPLEYDHQIRDKKVVAEFDETISEVFPDDWVRNSNAMESKLLLQRVTKSSGRAHYSPALEIEYRYTTKYKPEPDDDVYAGWVEQVDENGKPKGVWTGPKRDFLENRHPLNYKKFDGDKPKGKGWVRGQTVHRGRVYQGWVRENPTDAKKRSELSSSNLTVATDRTDFENKQSNQHEFAHRMEDANKHITFLEEGFLVSRTTLPDGTREPLMVSQNGKVQYQNHRTGDTMYQRELLREDNFVTPYIGREYGKDPREMREVLSVGTESVFGGSHGGLVGIGHTRSDPEMRNWILGVYATQ